MRARLILTLACLLSCLASFAQTDSTQTKEAADSTINIVGYFCKNDTLTYWINETEWDMKDKDTTLTMNVSTKVRLVVTDSTKSGYAMDYTFLDFKNGQTKDSELSDYVDRLIAKFSDRVIGTTIKFHTDEMGKIVKIDNLKEIKKQAKQLFSAAMKDMPYIDSLKSIGFDIKPMLKKINTDKLVAGYTEELELLFKWHGMSFPIGENNVHEDATDDSYASDTYIYAGTLDDDEYELYYNIEQEIPAEDVNTLIGAVYETFTSEEMPDSMKQAFNEQVNVPAKIASRYSATYLWNGWPRKVVSQSERMIANRGKLEQKTIEWETISTGNY